VPPDRPAELGAALDAALSRTWDAEALRATVPSLSWDAVARTYDRLVEEVVSAWRPSSTTVRSPR
jgi:hypothetical protein